eukprot:scaffold1127_cov361-Prasinococcus_capsulatus_cf.AAC.8
MRPQVVQQAVARASLACTSRHRQPSLASSQRACAVRETSSTGQQTVDGQTIGQSVVASVAPSSHM